MTGRVLSGFRHDLQISGRWTAAGHTRAIVWAAIAAGVIAIGLGR